MFADGEWKNSWRAVSGKFVCLRDSKFPFRSDKHTYIIARAVSRQIFTTAYKSVDAVRQ